jgi:hypothetical protein
MESSQLCKCGTSRIAALPCAIWFLAAQSGTWLATNCWRGGWMFLYSTVQYGYWGKVETSALASEPSAHEGAHRAFLSLRTCPSLLGQV